MSTYCAVVNCDGLNASERLAAIRSRAARALCPECGRPMSVFSLDTAAAVLVCSHCHVQTTVARKSPGYRAAAVRALALLAVCVCLLVSCSPARARPDAGLCLSAESEQLARELDDLHEHSLRIDALQRDVKAAAADRALEDALRWSRGCRPCPPLPGGAP